MSGNWSLFYQQIFLSGKNRKVSKRFRRVFFQDILFLNEKEVFILATFYAFDIHIYGEIYTIDCIFFHTIKCKYMSVNVGMKLPRWEGKGNILSCLVLIQCCFETATIIMGAQTFVPQKRIFLYLHSA